MTGEFIMISRESSLPFEPSQIETQVYHMSRTNGEIAGKLLATCLLAQEEIATKNRELSRDHMTDLYNRKALNSFGEEWVANKKPFVLIFYDLTNFKLMNDRFGHEEGNLLLMNTADIISYQKRKDDVIARVGGDEFVGMFELTPRLDSDEEITSIERAQKIVDRTNKLFDEHLETIGMNNYGFGVSMGAVVYDPAVHATFLDVYNQADHKMLAHKKEQHKDLGCYRSQHTPSS